MADVVVTVPKGLWQMWLEEGQLPGDEWDGMESHFWLGGPLPNIQPTERVYIVAHGKLRGYAPLVRMEQSCRLRPSVGCLLRRNDAVAVTILEPIRGFQGWRHVWWKREDEIPFPEWMQP